MVMARKYSGVICCSDSFIMGQFMPQKIVRPIRAHVCCRVSVLTAAPLLVLHRYRRFDGGVALVVTHLKVFKGVIKQRFGAALEVQRGVGVSRALQLGLHLLVMVVVDVAVATGPNKITYVQFALLRQHMGE